MQLCSAALRVAIAQACYAISEDHERAVLQKLLGQLDLEGDLIQADALHTQRPFFDSSRIRGPTFLLTVKPNQKTLHRQIGDELRGKRKMPFLATDHEISHGCDITWNLRPKEAPDHIKENWYGTSWIVEVIATGMRDGKPMQASHVFLTSLRTTPEVLLQLVRSRWSLESWHWVRDTQLREDDHRYRCNGAALNLLRLVEFGSIREGLQSVMHDIAALLAMARRQLEPNP